MANEESRAIRRQQCSCLSTPGDPSEVRQSERVCAFERVSSCAALNSRRQTSRHCRIKRRRAVYLERRGSFLDCSLVSKICTVSSRSEKQRDKAKWRDARAHAQEMVERLKNAPPPLLNDFPWFPSIWSLHPRARAISKRRIISQLRALSSTV